MRIYIQFIRKIIQHKFYVALALWELYKLYPLKPYLLVLMLTHDLSKLSPQEFFGYANFFYGEGRNAEKHSTRYKLAKAEYDRAWNNHQHFNKHHWQYYLLTDYKGNIEPIPMPSIYILEMVADWIGAGKTYNSSNNVIQWYEKNESNIILHKQTRNSLEIILYRKLKV